MIIRVRVSASFAQMFRTGAIIPGMQVTDGIPPGFVLTDAEFESSSGTVLFEFTDGKVDNALEYKAITAKGI